MTRGDAAHRALGASRRGVALAAAVTVLLSLGACSRENAASSAGAPRFEQSRSVSSDVLSVAMHLSSSSITVADRVSLLIEARRTDGKPLEWPDALRDAKEGEPFGQPAVQPAAENQITPAQPWTVLAVSRQVVAPGHELLTLTLEPYLPGDKVIPAMRFGQGVGAVSTDELAVKVASTQPGDTAAQAAPPSPGEPDSLAALDDLGPALPPASIRVPLWRRPLVIGIAGGAAALLVLGLGGAWAARKLLRRTPDADEAFRREMRAVRATHAAESDPAAAIEASIGALRRWLDARRICSPGATAFDVMSWILGAVRAGMLGQEAVEVAALYTSIDVFRFGPDAGTRSDIAAKVVELVGRLAESAGRAIPPEETARLMHTLAQMGDEARLMTALADTMKGGAR